MARKIITSVREQFDIWFRENVSPKIPTIEEVAAARALMVEAQKKHEILKSRYESYQMGLKLLTPGQSIFGIVKPSEVKRIASTQSETLP